MRDLAGKTAVITGAGSGIGRGTALALADAGMNVVVADIDLDSASAVRDEVLGLGVRSIAVRTDVADKASVDALADSAWAEFGAVHVLHNNAGVALFVPLDQMSDADWRWIIDVNLLGVVNGIQAFLPRLKEQEGEKHIVNTASMAGIASTVALGAYSATKFAIVALSEVLREEQAANGIAVSVLCPGFVATNLSSTSDARRPAGGGETDFSGLGSIDPSMLQFMPAEEAGKIVRRGIEENEPYILTHPEWEPMAQMRFDAVLASFQRQASARALEGTA